MNHLGVKIAQEDFAQVYQTENSRYAVSFDDARELAIADIPTLALAMKIAREASDAILRHIIQERVKPHDRCLIDGG